jgi:lipoyl(octanoyl) transferase
VTLTAGSQSGLRVVDLGRMAYEEAFALQERTVEDRKAGRIGDTLLLVEHDPVYTLGRNATEENIVQTREELARAGISVVRTTRGGQVTYHGPGQLVGYPILELGGRERGVTAYIDSLEKVLILLLSEYGVQAGTDSRNRGVWVGNDKIAAIGIRVTRGITMHGFALNVKTELRQYSGIVPCGIRGAGVTSLALLVPGVDMEDVKRRLIARFRDVFGYGEEA